MPFNLFLIGLISILGQVVILRELSVAFYGIELIYILAIGIWLLWTGIGALIGKRTFKPAHKFIALLFLAFALILPLDVAYVRVIRVLFGSIPGAYLPFLQQLLAIAIALLPICLLLGLLFQWAAKIYVEKSGKTLARAYAIESVGGIIGGLAATLFLKAGVQNLTAAVICSIGACLIFFSSTGFRGSRVLKAVSLILALLLLSSLFAVKKIDRLMTRWNHPELLDTRDTPYGRVTINSVRGQFVVFENDALCFETQGTAAEVFAHLSMLQHHDPEKILILGGGVEGLVYEVLKHSPGHIDYVELNGGMLEMVMRCLPEEIKRFLNYDEVCTVIDDPRKFLGGEDRYDMIMVGMPQPTSGQTNRYYTREFFASCAGMLKPGGILSFRLRSAENLWTPNLRKRNASIYKALKEVFPFITVLPGVTNVIVASQDRLLAGHKTIIGRLIARKIPARLVTPEYIYYVYTNDRFLEIREILESEDVPVNSDTRPICYQYTLMIWLSKFYTGLAHTDLSLTGKDGYRGSAIGGIILLVTVVFFLLIRKRRDTGKIILVAAAGLIGMVMEALLILHYQTRNGILFQDIGLLLTAFMLGLALGAHFIGRIYGSLNKGTHLGISLVIGFVLLNAVIMLTINLPVMSSLFSICLMLILTGAFVAGIFAFSSLDRVQDQVRVVSPLYGADLIGGCVGSLVGVLILIPMAGLPATAGVMAVLSLLCLLLVI